MATRPPPPCVEYQCCEHEKTCRNHASDSTNETNHADCGRHAPHGASEALFCLNTPHVSRALRRSTPPPGASIGRYSSGFLSPVGAVVVGHLLAVKRARWGPSATRFGAPLMELWGQLRDAPPLPPPRAPPRGCRALSFALPCASWAGCGGRSRRSRRPAACSRAFPPPPPAPPPRTILGRVLAALLRAPPPGCRRRCSVGRVRRRLEVVSPLGPPPFPLAAASRQLCVGTTACARIAFDNGAPPR